MLQHDRIDFSKEIASKELFTWRFKYEAYLCNDCHDLMQKAMNIDDAAIDFVEENNIAFIFGIWAKMML